MRVLLDCLQCLYLNLGGNYTAWGLWPFFELFSSVQFSHSVVSDSLRTHESQHARPPCPSATPGVHSDSRPSSQWCHPAISSSVTPSPPAPNTSQHQSLFQWVNSSHELTTVLSFSFSISPSKEIPGLISFRMNWLDLLAVQGTLKSLLQYHSSKASILQHSAFFIVQLSHPYMTTRKIIALTRWTFMGKVMSLLFNTALQIAVKRRKAKSKGKKERYTHLSAKFQRIARRDKKPFLSDQCKEIEENNRNSETLFFWPPESLQMVTAVMKLKDTCSLEEKLWQTRTVY